MGIFRNKEANLIYKSIAKAQGVSVAQVKADMVEAIEQSRNNPDPEVRAKFKQIFGNRTPTPEEFVIKMAKKL